MTNQPKNNKKTIHLLTGGDATGKSTYAKKLKQSNKAEIVSFADTPKMILAFAFSAIINNAEFDAIDFDVNKLTSGTYELKAPNAKNFDHDYLKHWLNWLSTNPGPKDSETIVRGIHNDYLTFISGDRCLGLRQPLIDLSELCKKFISNDIWANLALNRIYGSSHQKFIIDDLRFITELETFNPINLPDYKIKLTIVGSEDAQQKFGDGVRALREKAEELNIPINLYNWKNK